MRGDTVEKEKEKKRAKAKAKKQNKPALTNRERKLKLTKEQRAIYRYTGDDFINDSEITIKPINAGQNIMVNNSKNNSSSEAKEESVEELM